MNLSQFYTNVKIFRPLLTLWHISNCDSLHILRLLSALNRLTKKWPSSIMLKTSLEFKMNTPPELLEDIKNIILENIAATQLKGFWHPMYGGLVFELEDGNRKSGIGGVFISKKHVSFEFSNGYLLDDIAGKLEGGGKFRRHLKLKNLNDIADKQLIGYFKQAHALGLEQLKT